MRAGDSDVAFGRLLAERGLSVEALTADSAIDAMMEFYVAHRATDVANIDDEEDMLLFQWGTYDWGAGASFEYNITRQFIVGGRDDPDDAVWQLSLTVRFEPDKQNAQAGDDSCWCEHPSQADTLKQFIDQSPATLYARTARPTQVELRLEQVG